MTKNNKNLIFFLYISFFLLGIAIRFVRLGTDPLSQNESYMAFQAFEGLSHNLSNAISQSSYFGLTIFSFFLTNSSEFIARFWPALVGSLMIFIPLFWKKELGQVATLGLIFVLSIDPVLVHASRTIGSSIFVIFGLMAFISLIYHKRPALSGIALAIALLGGESFWFVLLCVGITWIILLSLTKRKDVSESSSKGILKILALDRKQIYPGIIGFVITLLLIGSGFSLYPSGLGEMMTGLIGFFQKFFVKSGIPIWRPLFALIAYQFLPLSVAIWAGVHAWIKKDTFGRMLSLYSFIVFLLITILPGRELIDITWLTLPLWILAVRFVSNSLDWSKQGILIKAIVAGITIIFLIYLALVIRAFVNPEFSQVNFNTYIIIPIAVLLLMIVSVVLMGIGWRFSYSLNGLVIGILAFFIVATVSSGISMIPKVGAARVELWLHEENLPNSTLIVETIESISDLYLGDEHTAEVFVIDSNLPELKWMFRQFNNVSFYSSLPADKQPDIVITREINLENLDLSYRGEEFVGQQVIAWDRMHFVDYIKWLIDHKVNYDKKPLYLWVSSDLFPNG